MVRSHHEALGRRYQDQSQERLYPSMAAPSVLLPASKVSQPLKRAQLAIEQVFQHGLVGTTPDPSPNSLSPHSFALIHTPRLSPGPLPWTTRVS